jgi:ribonuclease E
VLNQAEALVAIDVNSGRATREHHIEDTALKTNLEAAEEIARQLRLRDLAGLIVIDFIDMDEKRNNRAVERRLKECLRHERARIQVGHISHFGLLEMSRQRIRSSVLESSTEKCPNCGGTGHVRSVSSVALQLLRAIEEMLLKGATHNLTVRTRSDIALYLLNHKRAHLRALEERFRISILVNADPSIAGQVSFLIEKGEQIHSPEQAKALASREISFETRRQVREKEEDELEGQRLSEPIAAEETEMMSLNADLPAEEAEELDEGELPTDPASQQGHARKRRRRRRGRRGENREEGAFPRELAADGLIEHARDGGHAAQGSEQDSEDADSEPQVRPAPDRALASAEGVRANEAGPRGRRRRGRRGGREHRRDDPTKPPPGEIEAEVAHGSADAPPARSPELRQQDGLHAAESAHAVENRPFEAARIEPTPLEPHEHAASGETALEKPGSAESHRRRSTVREPALASHDHPNDYRDPMSQPPEPIEPTEPIVSSSTEAERSDRTPRSGWWRKRVFGRS